MLKIPGTRPETLGVSDGRLSPCRSDKGSCLCSQDQGPYRVPPFAFSGDPYDAMTRMVAVLLQQPRATIVTQTREYLHAEFESRWLGRVDDLEFLLVAAESVIHVRSASRLPVPDLGLNRARVEELREAFDNAD